MSTDELKDEGAQSGYAEAAHWCPHVAANVQPIDLAEHETLDPNHTVCSRCPNQNENWFCLQCQTLFCGRFAQGHMLAHYEATGHCVAAGLADLSFWCYRCESYLYHRTIPKLYASYAILTMLKFHEAPVDHPLPSAEPTATIAEGAEEEEEEKSEEETDDAHMETSRTAAAAAAAGGPPSRSSSQLEPYSPADGDDDQSSTAAPSRNASLESSSAPAAAAAAGTAPAAAASSSSSASAYGPAAAAGPPSSVASPIAGLSPLQMAHPLIQKILGVIYGNCLGDAFGLATEFLDREAVAQLYGPKYEPATGAGSIPFPHTKQTRHSSRWDRGDWTDDSDQMILILETILETFGAAPVEGEEEEVEAADLVPSPSLFAFKLKSWVRNGFPELGDMAGMGLGALTHQVVTHKSFLKDPHGAAEAVWTASGKKAAANGGVMRTSICGVFDYKDMARVHANTKAMCKVTHADPRCIASCILITTAIAGILQGALIDTPEQTEAFLQQCLARTLQAVPTLQGEELAVFQQYFAMRDLAELKLDDPPAIGFTNKCMASGLFGLRSQESFAVTITRLTREAGDADTNGAVCGAMIGARRGYDGLPSAWLNKMPNKKWLDAKVVQLIQLMFQRFEAEQKKQKSATAAGAGAAAAAASS